VREQERLRSRVVRERRFGQIAAVAGADVSVRGDRAIAALVVMTYPALELLEEVTVARPLEFPYIPGLLAFREIPALAAAFERLRTRPDVVLVDGHGLAHPRRFGVACHLGVTLDVPAIGCGKSRLVGTHAEPGPRRPSRRALRDGSETIGAALRTRSGVKPLFVSIGHRIDLDTAVRIVLRCAPRYRLPEPIRAADRLAGGRVAC
jgi:deoxyribonuclease V